jgi:O-antigen/teichoic acid export membrane protein
MGYTKQTIAGFTWHTALIVGITIVTGLKLMVLARLLMPHDFGLYSLVVIVLGLTEALTQTGINITIIQSKQSIDYFINTAWVISIARGFCIAILMSIAGVGMAYLYAEPSLQFWIVLAAIVPIIKGFINPAVITFHKELQFFRDSVYRFSLVVVEALVTCAVAVFTQSVTAFIAGIIVSAIFEVTISFLFLRTRPRFEWIPNRATQIFANAKGLSLAAVLSYLQDNADNFLIGKLLGVSTLGLYQNGYALSHKPVFGVSQAMSHSTMPIFSRLAGSGERLQRAFYRATFGLTALLFCIALPTLFFPEFIIKLLLGENWLGLVPAVPWLVAGAVLAGVANQGYTLLVSLKEYFTMNLHRALVISVFIILLFAQGAAAGLVGAAMAVFFARLLCLPFLGWYVIKKLRV